ncbi:unnamed protein product [Arabis nemorensis]|uniref:arginine--tRNA ligase n=1 Tax=Arabis nemorensis TaxID=586526 RepID=A0A565AWJ9_9BRAS|nr:unnamed protein product [Arabis nemorensis]
MLLLNQHFPMKLVLSPWLMHPHILEISPGFINVVLSSAWMAKCIESMLINGIDSWAPKLSVKRAVVDFCSPNIAKEMHVGHLRSITIGDTLARMLEYSKVQVLRRNHVGDWGTQFGMLIEYLFEQFPGSDGSAVTAIRDLQSDGGFTYDTTDMAALWYRLNEEKAEWIIYVTEANQEGHFDRLFKAARKADWLPSNDKTYPRASHVRFGQVLGEGKDKEWTLEELNQTAEAVGYGALKYADLKNNRSTDYSFSFDQMLNDKGDTVVYLLRAHARICSIIRKSGKDIDELKKTGKLALDHAEERALGLHLLRFTETVEEACTKLLPNVLCEYLYKLSKHCTKF